MKDETNSASTSAERPFAPGDLATLEAFVNTVDLATGADELDSPAALAGWLGRHNLLTGEAAADAADLGDALALREALRSLLYANCCGGDVDEARATLDRLAGRCSLCMRLGPDGMLQLEPVQGGVAGALARLLAIAFAAAAAGTWQRLKACRNTGCRWAFYDTSKNRSGAWCNMAVCGNRAKVRAYQQRRKR